MVRGCGFADIHFHMHQLVRAFDALGGDHEADAQVDFQEIVDGDFGSIAGSAGSPASCPAARLVRPKSFSSNSRMLVTASFNSMRGKTPRDLANGMALSQPPPMQRFEIHGIEWFLHPELRPDLSADCGSTGESSAVTTRKASAAV